MIFDYIVVGKGMMGSAAAKYLSGSKKKVAVIGPDENIDNNKAVVFSSHYDQARIQRIIGHDDVWTLLNLQSAQQYNFIENQSNISFHTPKGCLYVNPEGMDVYLNEIKKSENLFNLKYTFFENSKALQNAFPDFHFPPSSKAIFEDAPSGYINPQLLIKAQLILFKKNNGIIINNIANEITYEKNFLQIKTLDKKIYQAKKVLLCPGAFINFFNLTKNKLALSLKSETIIWANVSKQEATRLSNLPSLIYEIKIPEYKNVYLIQPVMYPDGNYYLKMGCNLPSDRFFDNLTDIQNWFRNGASDDNLEILKDALLKILPGIKIKKNFTKRCIVSYTKHRKPYIGALNNDGLFAACGGNGYSAMCSDALGKIAANLLIENNFLQGYSAQSFQPVFIND